MSYSKTCALAVLGLISGCGNTIALGNDGGPVMDAPASTDALSVDAPRSDGAVSASEVRGWIEAYQTAHPGNGGMDWDINEKTPAEVAADPDAQRLLALCGADQRPVIPLLAWEYGGADHRWMNPSASALVYCVYTPVSPSTDHWAYDAASDHVTADVYVLFPEENPCADRLGAEQVQSCIGHSSNFEILVDASSYHDGVGATTTLANASTELRLILPDGSRVHLLTAG